MDNRIKEKGGLFAGLDPATQAKIRSGRVDLGFSAEMVYLALGEPAAKHELTTRAGRDEIWIYLACDYPSAGLDPLGYHRRVYFNPSLNGYHVFYRPILTDDPAVASGERLRVTIHEGQVAAIEQAKPQ